MSTIAGMCPRKVTERAVWNKGAGKETRDLMMGTRRALASDADMIRGVPFVMGGDRWVSISEAEGEMLYSYRRIRAVRIPELMSGVVSLSYKAT